MASKIVESDFEREALGEALAWAFAAVRLAPVGTALFETSALPAFALWVHVVHPLSPALSVVAAWAWLACVLPAVGLSIMARRYAGRLARARPRTAPLAGIHLARRDHLATFTSRIAGLAAVAATPLALHVFAPWALSDELVAQAAAAWLIVTSIGMTARYSQGGPWARR